MTTPNKGFPHAKDYFIANIEDGELAMRPYCSCGTQLNEDYFCDSCHKQCLCTHIFCVDETILSRVKKFIAESSSFSKFEATLLPE